MIPPSLTRHDFPMPISNLIHQEPENLFDRYPVAMQLKSSCARFNATRYVVRALPKDHAVVGSNPVPQLRNGNMVPFLMYRVRKRKWENVLKCNFSIIMISFWQLFGTIRKACLSTFRIKLSFLDSTRMFRVMS